MTALLWFLAGIIVALLLPVLVRGLRWDRVDRLPVHQERRRIWIEHERSGDGR